MLKAIWRKSQPQSRKHLNGAKRPQKRWKNWKAPFIFYIPTEDSEEETLAGPSGLQSFTAQVHFVAGTHRGLQLLCQTLADEHVNVIFCYASFILTNTSIRERNVYHNLFSVF